MALSEVLRELAVSDLHKLKTFRRCWPTWQQKIHAIAGNPPTAQGLVTDLGESLGPVFRTTSAAGRGQGTLSGGGSGWEALVCWYLNLCLIGTRTVVVKKKSQWPTPIRDALTLSYGTSQTNSESDLIAITFPSSAAFSGFAANYSGKSKEGVDSQLSGVMGNVELCVIQCKTNWNDNAQIPMLWDLVYSATNFRIPGASIGRNTHSIKTLKEFAYAFVALPSNKLSNYKTTSMPVLRVAKLSGGNYWGYPRKKGVAGELGDIFSRNFHSSTTNLGLPWLNHLDEQLKNLHARYAYFQY